MKLSEYAKELGVSYRTVFRWFQENRLPDDVISKQTPSGTIIIEKIVDNSHFEQKNIFIYCRVSSYEKKDDLNRQIKRCEDYCISSGYKITKVFKEIGSGMNDNRTQLTKMLNSNPNIIVIENKDRITRFGFNYLNLLLSKMNCKIDIINVENNNEKDLNKDLISIISSFCCRLYGMRKGYNKAKSIKDKIENNNI